MSIARKQLYKHFRNLTRDRKRQDLDLGVSSIRALDQSPSSVIAAQEREGLVLEALQRVSVEYQTILELHYWECLSASDIAQVIDIKPGTVRVRLHRARRALHEMFGELVQPQDDDEGMNVDAIARALGRKV